MRGVRGACPPAAPEGRDKEVVALCVFGSYPSVHLPCPPMTFVLLLIDAALASDVLVPTFTPQTTSDFALADRLTEDTLAALAEAGASAVPPDEIMRRAGEVADGCAEEPTCTAVLWREFPRARVAVVGAATWAGDQVTVKVRFYGPDDTSPIEVIATTVPEAELTSVSEQIAFFAREMLGLVPPRSARPVEPEPEPEPPPGRESEETDEFEEDERDEGRSEEPPPADEEGEDRGHHRYGLPHRAWKRYEASGLSFGDWRDQALVRAGTVIIEVTAGAAFGDVDRRYDTRVALDQQSDDSMTQRDVYQYESFVTGNAFSVGAAVGYVPQWWFEVGVSGGAQFGHKQLTTGWELYLADDPEDLRESDSRTYDPVAATLAFVEPRLRLYVLPTGPVKPYAAGGVQVRFFDGYLVPDLVAVDYPDRPGGVSVGLCPGGGLAFDIPGGAIGFLEGAWSRVLVPEPYLAGGAEIDGIPEMVEGTGQVVLFRGGLGVRL